MRHLLPERRQRMYRIKHTGQERQRHDDEILERRHLVELVRPDTGNDAEGAEQRAAEYREYQRPQWLLQGQIDE